MHQPVDHRGGNHVITEDLSPAPESHIRGHQYRALFIPVRNKLEQEIRCFRVEG